MASHQPASTNTQPLAMMTKLSPFVSFYEPAESPSSDDTDPRLIIVASWMDARDVHIAKYITRYQALYPRSRILLVKFIFKHILRLSEGARAVQPAVSFFRSQIESGYLSGSPSPQHPQVLLHVFSNGGIASSRHLMEAYQAQTGSAFPLHTAVYDSCPGIWSYTRQVNATMASGPKGIWQWILLPVVHALVIWYCVRIFIFRKPEVLTVNANFHNDLKKVRQTNRAYIYGTKDIMVDWRHVELHAKQAQAKGYVVRNEVFPDTPHVAHMRSDEARYWTIVKETWSGLP